MDESGKEEVISQLEGQREKNDRQKEELGGAAGQRVVGGAGKYIT